MPSSPHRRLDADAYRRAERLLPHNRKELVPNGRVRPEWIDGGARFRYRVGDEVFLVDPAGGIRQPAGEDAAPDQADPLEVRSPDRRLVVFRSGYDLWVRDCGSGEERALTADGTADLGYGTPPDCLNYAVLMRRFGLPHLPPHVAWAPDSSRILTHRTDQRGIRLQHLVEAAPAGGGPPVLHSARYPLPGDKHVARAELIVIDVEQGSVVESSVEPLLMPLFSPIMAKWAWWAAGGDAVYYLDQPRDLLTLSLARLDPATGEVRTLIEESGESRVWPHQFLGYPPIVHVSADGREALWYSQRDGWGHLYRYDTETGDLLGQVTSGDWHVLQILRVDEEAGVVWFVGAGLVADDPYRRQVCRVRLDGSGFERLGGDDLDHVVDVSPNGAYYVDSASTTDTPPVIAVRAWDGRVLLELERADISALEAAGWAPPERFRVTAADGVTDLYGLLYRPHDFDPGKAYPVLDSPYPGPNHGRVEPSFDQGLHDSDSAAFACLGFVVFAIDGRGTPGRSKAFLDHSNGRIDDAGSLDDHVAALGQLAEMRPWMDLDRVGIYGLSGGGFATVRAMCAFPERYKAGVSKPGTTTSASTCPASRRPTTAATTMRCTRGPPTSRSPTGSRESCCSFTARWTTTCTRTSRCGWSIA